MWLQSSPLRCHPGRRRRSLWAPVQAPALLAALMSAVGLSACVHRVETRPGALATCGPDHTVQADVVALEHVLSFNRFGSFNPAGMVYALRRDLDSSSQWTSDTEAVERAGRVSLRPDKRPRPLVLRVNEGDCIEVTFWNMLTPYPSTHSSLRRADYPPGTVAEHAVVPGTSERLVPLQRSEDSGFPATREASMHVNGLDYRDIGADGANVGRNPSSLVKPGHKTVYRWYGKAEGAYLMYSTGALAGGEGDGGQLGLGLFGVVIVEPRGSSWYRSQVAHAQLRAAAAVDSAGLPDYARLDYAKLAMLSPQREILHTDLNAIIYRPEEGLPATLDGCKHAPPGSSCHASFREFTTVFHDENDVFQAFYELGDESNPINRVADGMAINYGSSGMGAPVLASRKGLGPAKNCVECKFEEFFLSSWANGDPAMIVRRDGVGRAVEALYADDPSNVHHSYLNDTVRFRNLHAGPKETHVFHLHAHQWLKDGNDLNANYLDSQTISPGSSFSYEIHYGGSGNRNLTVGDSIFHCHLYPHFAAGMWELWRSHDVFEDGTPGLFGPSNMNGRALPDGEIEFGTPNPAVVPIPGHPLAPAPTAAFRGYPFYIPGVVGHRPPQPPLDMALDDAATGPETARELSGGLPRHVVVGGVVAGEAPTAELLEGLGDDEETKASRYIAKRTHALNGDRALLSFARRLEQADLEILPRCGTDAERVAMNFHAIGQATAPPSADDSCWTAAPVPPDVDRPAGWIARGLPVPNWRGKPTGPARLAATPDGSPGGRGDTTFNVNGLPPAPGAPFANPCPVDAPARTYRSAYLQFDLTVNKYGWHDPQARMPVLEGDIAGTLLRTRLPEPLFFRANSNDCIQFQATNLIPSALNLDDFQIYSPTDTIGQHIHLVKFDVTSSDGSGNGWNYEDGTFSADEVRERVHAYANYLTANGRTAEAAAVRPKTHPLFRPGGPLAGNQAFVDAGKLKLGQCSDVTGNPADDDPVTGQPWCGAQSTVQRWWADPLLNDRAEDRTLRAVFTHDHFGPSSHQQHGFYAALIVEPKDSIWTQIGTPLDTMAAAVTGEPGCQQAGLIGGSRNGLPVVCRDDGGPTSYQANIGYSAATWNAMPPARQESAARDVRREFNLAFADFAILYDALMQPVNPPGRDTEGALPSLGVATSKPQPEGISAEDPGTRLLNYRNEPVPLRIGEPDQNTLQYRQALDPQGRPTLKGDMAHVFWSPAHLGDDDPLSDAQKDAEALRRTDLVALNSAEVFDSATRNELHGLLRTQLDRSDIFRAQIRASEPWRSNGDPSTPVLAAYEGDPLKLHLVQGAQEEQHVFTMNGAKWLAQPHSANSGWMNGQQIGISEHFEFDLDVSASGASTTDYWFGSAAVENVWDGMWGTLRSYGIVGETNQPAQVDQLARLPAAAVPVPPALPPAPARDNVCPRGPDLSLRTYYVAAWLARDILVDASGAPRGLAYNRRFDITDPSAVILTELPAEVANSWKSGANIRDYLRTRYRDSAPEPLVLRAAAGDCINVELKNYLPERVLDGPLFESASTNEEFDALRASWSFNLMPPIVSGLNFNDVQMSTAIGLAPQLVYEDVASSPAQTIGQNLPSGLPSNARGCQQPGSAEPFNACDNSGSEAPQYRWYAGDFSVVPVAKVGVCRDGHCTEVEIPDDDGKAIGAMIYTPIEFGATALRSLGDVIKHSSHGGVGALVILPKGSCYVRDPGGRTTAAEVFSGVAGDQVLADGSCTPAAVSNRRADFLDAVLIFQDDLSLKQHGQSMPNHRMADDAEDTGQKGFNYRSEPIWARTGVGTSGADLGALNQVFYQNALSSKPGTEAPAGCPPETGCGDPGVLFEASAGTRVRFRLVHPAGHSRQHAFTLYGHNFARYPFAERSTVLTPDGNEYGEWTAVVDGLAPGRHANVLVQAGGEFCVEGDYLFRAQENFQFQGGLWGIFRVTKNEHPPASCR